MAYTIHPTAYISPDAVLGDNVVVGPFAVIEANTIVGANCKIGAQAVIQPYVKMGEGNIVHPQVILGDLPQDIHFKAESVSWLEIGNGNVFREGFTAHRASVAGASTCIGSGGYFMNHSHVAHDCVIGDKAIFANNVAIGGFVQVGSNVFLGGNVVAHQYCRIGAYAIVQGTTGLNMDVIPFTLVGGRPARHFRLNTVGLRRAGIVAGQYRVLEAAFRLLRAKKPLEGLEETPELLQLKTWLAQKSKRGLHGFMTTEVRDRYSEA